MDPFRALADPVRRELLRALARGSARVVDLAAVHPISRPAVSKHLRVLVDAGLVRAETLGRERHYALVPGGTDPVRSLLADLDPRPRFDASLLDGLDLEVRRTVKHHQDAPASDAMEEIA
jgi:DNA-binding transcriptional ArsR family regulator